MKKTELTLIVFAVIAVLLKLLQLNETGALILLSFLVLAIHYLLFGFAYFNNIQFTRIFKRESYKESSVRRIIGAIGVGIAMSTATFGILFKLQSYPGTYPLLILSLCCLAVVLLVSLFKGRNGLEIYYSTIIKRTVIFGAIVVFLLEFPDKTWLNLVHPKNPTFVQAVLDATENPDDSALWDIVAYEREIMHKKSNK